MRHKKHFRYVLRTRCHFFVEKNIIYFRFITKNNFFGHDFLKILILINTCDSYKGKYSGTKNVAIIASHPPTQIAMIIDLK